MRHLQSPLIISITHVQRPKHRNPVRDIIRKLVFQSCPSQVNPDASKTRCLLFSTTVNITLHVAEKVVTTDALLTQRTFCKEVLEHQADYALPVKENHKQMYDDIQQLFEPLSETDATDVETRRFENLHTQEGAHLHTYTHVETSHGLTTTRTLTASTLLTDYIKWPGIAQVYQYQSQRENTKTAQISSQTQYGITSLSPEVASAEDLLKQSPNRRLHPPMK